MASHKLYNVPVAGVSGVQAKRACVDIDGRSVKGTLPAIICTVRMTSKGIRGFARVCEGWGISVRPAGSSEPAFIPSVEMLGKDCKDNGNSDFECIGTEAALTYLNGHPSVVRTLSRWKTANAVDCRASGASKKQ